MVLFMVGVIVYKLLVIHPLYENPNFQEYASTIVSVTGSIMNLIIIMVLSKVRKTGKMSLSNSSTFLRNAFHLLFHVKWLFKRRLSC